MDITNLSPQQLRHAADLQERIRGLQQELLCILEGTASSNPSAASAGPRRVFSKQAIENIRAGAVKRWEKHRAGQPRKTRAKTKGHISEAGRRALAAAVKARWAAAKAAGKMAL